MKLKCHIKTTLIHIFKSKNKKYISYQQFTTTYLFQKDEDDIRRHTSLNKYLHRQRQLVSQPTQSLEDVDAVVGHDGGQEEEVASSQQLAVVGGLLVSLVGRRHQHGEHRVYHGHQDLRQERDNLRLHTHNTSSARRTHHSPGASGSPSGTG